MAFFNEVFMKMYRAVAKQGFVENKVYEGQSTKRIPSNVPYIVDNIWEWCRPENAPSRRHAVYASPTPELALQNASSVGFNPDDYLVCELVFTDPNVKLAHLIIKDAREHDDISRIMRHVNSYFGKGFSDLPLVDKVKHAPLYLPSVDKQDLEAYFQSLNDNYELANSIKIISKFWSDVTFEPQNHNGELFFELSQAGTYTLKPI